MTARIIIRRERERLHAHAFLLSRVIGVIWWRLVNEVAPPMLGIGWWSNLWIMAVALILMRATVNDLNDRKRLSRLIQSEHDLKRRRGDS